MNLRDFSPYKLSFLICTYNSQKYIVDVLDSINSQHYPVKKVEIIIIDDNSTDKTLETVKNYRDGKFKLNIISKKKHQSRGAALSSNLGINTANGDLICFVDSDAVLAPNWLKAILPKFRDLAVGVVAGVIRTANPENMWAAFSGRELEDRYDSLKNDIVDHVSTCNTVYRQELFKKVGIFNEKLYYGYDVDLSYRARKMGYKILVAKNTYCLHHWRESARNYLIQVFNTGLARLQILGQYPDLRIGGRISGWKLMIQVPLTLLFIILLVLSFTNLNNIYLAAVMMLIVLAAQLPQTIRILIRYKDYRFLLFPLILTARNIVWVWVFIVYNIRNLVTQKSRYGKT